MAFDPLSIGTIGDSDDISSLMKIVESESESDSNINDNKKITKGEKQMTKAERKQQLRKAKVQAKKLAKKNAKLNKPITPINTESESESESENKDELKFDNNFAFQTDAGFVINEIIDTKNLKTEPSLLDNIISKAKLSLNDKNKTKSLKLKQKSKNADDNDDSTSTTTISFGDKTDNDLKLLEQQILGKEKKSLNLSNDKDYLDSNDNEELNDDEEHTDEDENSDDEDGSDIDESKLNFDDDEGDELISMDGDTPQNSKSNDDDDDILDKANKAMITNEKDRVNQKRKALYFTTPEEALKSKKSNSLQSSNMNLSKTSFTEMNLSRPILKGITSMGFATPTEIQSMTIPCALRGLDICGSAFTGSGKTGAFIIPILERLMYRPRENPCTRVLILVPTRELGVQCHQVGTNLAKFTDVTFALLVGGLNQKQQEVDLRKRPDVVIATPGRLIDHVYNSQSFTLDDIEILILDEADRMLEDGFSDELTEIIKATNKSRQTMLFSATMTENVDDLVRLSLRAPVRIEVGENNGITKKLVQEFVRVRLSKTPTTAIIDKGGNKISPQQQLMRNLQTRKTCILLALCKRTFKSETIIFFGSKQRAHEMRIIFGLMDLKCAELHGNLTQQQRLEALESFKNKTVDFLLATDLASRGLDIKGVRTVINFDMPKQYQQYVHRVGRTARAGQCGKSISLITEQDRQILKLAIKHSKDEIKTRIIKPEVIHLLEKVFNQKIRASLITILNQEKNEKDIRVAEMEVNKVQNKIKFEDEIKSRPKKEWFQSKSDAIKSKNKNKTKPTTSTSTSKPKKKLSNSKKKKLDRKEVVNTSFQKKHK